MDGCRVCGFVTVTVTVKTDDGRRRYDNTPSWSCRLVLRRKVCRIDLMLCVDVDVGTRYSVLHFATREEELKSSSEKAHARTE